MEKVFERLGSSKIRHIFCIVKSNEVLSPTSEAVAAHPTAAAVAVRAGTTLADVVTKMRSVGQVGYAARAYGLAFGNWVTLEPEALAYTCEDGDCFHFKFVLTEGSEDRSEQWARAVMQPFPYSVVDIESLRRALAEPLPLAMPIGSSTYSKLDAELVAPMFAPSTLYPADRIACHITGFMNSRVTPGMSENVLQSIWDQAFCLLWMDLLALADISGIEFNRNVADQSGASAKSVRPGLMLWILNRLCVKFEEKRESLAAALADLQRKLCCLPPQYYGPVQWIIGVALARNDMGVWAMRQGQVPDSMKLTMTSLKDKANCLRLSINFLRIALSLTNVFNQLTFTPRPFNELEPCTYGTREQITRTLVIVYPEVVKTIEPWSEHVEEGYTTLAYVMRAYAVKASTLISGGPQVNSRRRLDKFKVVLKPVGYDHMVTNEAELRCAIRDVLDALKALHSAGLVHRDVRWKNILKCDNCWMLIDLETVWESDWKPICSWLRAWDEKTLVAGRYTERSDLYLVGRLMNRIQLSAAGLDFQAKLLHHEFSSAQEALATDYMKRP